jgi:hypothetical protein
MHSIPSIRNISLALGLLLLTGCAQLYPRYSYRYNDTYAQSDFDELLAFGANMAEIPSSSRAKICRTLLKRQKDSQGVSIPLYLMVGRILSDTCGEIPRILDGVASIPAGSLTDERLQKFVSIQTETLKRMNNLSKKTGSVEHKSKTVESVPEAKDADVSKKNETRLLREKLEAIRSMEKHLDENSNAN